MPLGQWRWSDEKAPTGRSRVTEDIAGKPAEPRTPEDEQAGQQRPVIHGVQNLPNARTWPAGAKLVQWVRLDPKAPPRNLVLLAKGDGNWTHAAAWGKFDVAALRQDPRRAFWFLHAFYRHAYGFLGWGTDLVGKALPYIPEKVAAMGELPKTGAWIKLEVPLDRIGAVGPLVDGVGCMQKGGRVWWGPTSVVADKEETLVLGDSLALPPEQLKETKVRVAGLKAGTKVHVLFEDRELVAEDGFFVDDFRGQDLYQCFGAPGYGSDPWRCTFTKSPVPDGDRRHAGIGHGAQQGQALAVHPGNVDFRQRRGTYGE